MKKSCPFIKTILFCLLLLLCASAVSAGNEATEHTAAANAAWYDMLDFSE